MKLTEEQTAQLFLFTRKKMVHYYDLQVELVDHLANMIEEMMENEAGLTFETALKKAYSSFGLFGFAHIVQEKERQLFRKYNKMWWREMINQFRWPEIMLSAILLLLTWWAVNHVHIVELCTVFLGGWIICQVMLHRMMRHGNRSKKPLLMLQYSPEANSGFMLVYQFVGWSLIYTLNPYILTSIFIIGLLVQIANFRLLKKLRKEALQLYPEVFLKPA